jgi:nitroreductase
LTEFEWGLRRRCTADARTQVNIQLSAQSHFKARPPTSIELPMSEALNETALKQLFLDARTTNKFQLTPIADAKLQELVALMKWGPTSMNSQPGRIVFVRSPEAKAKLKGALMGGNIDKTMAAPVTAIVAYDTEFHEHLPAQFPAMPGARDMFHGNTSLIETTALRNSSLQGAYLILAARALGLDAGPMTASGSRTS